MAISDLSNLLSTPSGYATPDQIAQLNEYASALMKQGMNRKGPYFHPLQAVADALSPLFGRRMLEKTGQRELRSRYGLAEEGSPYSAGDPAAREGSADAGATIPESFGGTAEAGKLPQNFADLADKYNIDRNFLARTIKTESDWKPNARTGSYKGLTQLSDEEFAKNNIFPDGNIYNPIHNVGAFLNKSGKEARAFFEKNGRWPTHFDQYWQHNQGVAGYASHRARLDDLAWRNFLRADPKHGPVYARKAIWGNMTPSDQARYGSVDRVTSRDFLNSQLGRRNSNTALAYNAPDLPGLGMPKGMTDVASIPGVETPTGAPRAAPEQAPAEAPEEEGPVRVAGDVMAARPPGGGAVGAPGTAVPPISRTAPAGPGGTVDIPPSTLPQRVPVTRRQFITSQANPWNSPMMQALTAQQYYMQGQPVEADIGYGNKVVVGRDGIPRVIRGEHKLPYDVPGAKGDAPYTVNPATGEIEFMPFASPPAPRPPGPSGSLLPPTAPPPLSSGGVGLASAGPAGRTRLAGSAPTPDTVAAGNMDAIPGVSSPTGAPPVRVAQAEERPAYPPNVLGPIPPMKPPPGAVGSAPVPLPPFIGPMSEWGRGAAADAERQKEEAKLLSKSDTDYYKDVGAKGDAARDGMDDIQMAMRLVDDPSFRSGWGGNAIQTFRKMMVQAGLADAKDTTVATELFNKFVAGLNLTKLRQSLQGLGQVRIFEGNLVSQSLSNINNTPEATRFLLRYQFLSAQRIATASQAAEDYREKYGIRGLKKYLKDNFYYKPIMDKSEFDDWKSRVHSSPGFRPIEPGSADKPPAGVVPR